VESGEKQRELTRVDVVEIARGAVETVRPDAETRQITIHFGGPETAPMTADHGEIEIILNNLLSNAVKYNRDGGRIDIDLSVDDARVNIRVSDTGIGMTADEAARLFNDFVRIHTDKTRDIWAAGWGCRW